MALSMRFGTTTTPRRPPASASGEDESRRIGPRIGLPTGRALVGGLLVALSVIGIFAAHRAATADRRVDYLIVAHDVAGGARLRAEDLALAPMDLYVGTRGRAITNPNDVIGRVAVSPLHEGDLLLRSSTIAAADAATTSRRVGLSLDAADALGGEVSVGDRVDLVSVPRSEGPAQVIVRGAVVTAVGGTADAGVGSAEHVRLNLDVATEEDARLVVEAHARGGVTLVAASNMAFGDPGPGPGRR